MATEITNLEKHREILSSSFSVGILVDDADHERLLLVRQKATKQWGVVAGGMSRKPDGNIESFLEAAQREYFEEAGSAGVPLFIPELTGPIGVFLLETGSRARFGLILKSRLSLFSNSIFELSRTDSEEIDLVKTFSASELLGLLRESKKIYRPQFNRDLIIYWLREYAIRKYGNYQIIGKNLAHHMIEQWGVGEPSPNFQLFPKDMTLAFLEEANL